MGKQMQDVRKAGQFASPQIWPLPFSYHLIPQSGWVSKNIKTAAPLPLPLPLTWR